LKKFALGMEYLDIIIKFSLHFKSFLTPSFTKHTAQDKNANSSVAISKNYTFS
jgi:hypothetical protein